ncbi:MAG: SMP-30/gluconolactonase/LRE family protein [Opitutales bacterium]|nr:SMP-30/gluconolactonase/LRE family protein [Opitutales bacterium]
MTNNVTIRPLGSRVSKWGEGPIYMNDRLLYVDIEGHALICLNPETEREETWEMGERIGTVVPRKSGGFLCAGDSGIYSFDPQTGLTENFADPEAAKRPENRFNDGKCDPSGRFWAGTISTVKKKGDANLYMLDTEGSLQLKIPDVTNSNGICWDMAKHKMYYIDTPTKEIVSYDYDDETGAIDNRLVIFDTSKAEMEGSPDGMTIDADGHLWVALCHGGCVVNINAATGGMLQKIDFPCVETTACAFGGVGLNQLFVTTGIHKSLKEEHAGKVFVVDGLSCRGVPSFAYSG